MMVYLDIADIVLINKATVERHGGNFVPPLNLLNEERLNYLVDAVSAEMFGAPLYPTISDKAAFYMFSVVSNHVFQDGNKRTGLEAAFVFLQLNGMQIKQDLPNQDIFDFTIALASGSVDLEQCKQWFSENTEEI